MDLSECMVDMSLADTEVNLREAGNQGSANGSSSDEGDLARGDRACGVVIDGVHTDIVIKIYRNRIFLIISQYKKFGSMVTVSREAALSSFNSDTYSIKTILGKDDSDIHLAARFIAEQIDIDKPLLLSVCLRDYGVDTLRAIVAVLKQIKSW